MIKNDRVGTISLWINIFPPPRLVYLDWLFQWYGKKDHPPPSASCARKRYPRMVNFGRRFYSYQSLRERNLLMSGYKLKRAASLQRTPKRETARAIERLSHPQMKHLIIGVFSTLIMLAPPFFSKEKCLSLLYLASKKIGRSLTKIPGFVVLESSVNLFIRSMTTENYNTGCF